jgi:hypothetical protein
MNCPKCGADISDTFEPDDPSVGIIGGWSCDVCEIGIAEHEYPREPLEDDIWISRSSDEPLGTPINRISTQPGTDGYEEWIRISKSWGYS